MTEVLISDMFTWQNCGSSPKRLFYALDSSNISLLSDHSIPYLDLLHLLWDPLVHVGLYGGTVFAWPFVSHVSLRKRSGRDPVR